MVLNNISKCHFDRVPRRPVLLWKCAKMKILVKMGYKYSFLFGFYPLMLLIWDCSQNQNFKTIHMGAEKDFFFSKNNKNSPDFSCSHFFSHNLTFNLILNLYVTHTKSCWPLKWFYLYIFVHTCDKIFMKKM